MTMNETITYERYQRQMILPEFGVSGQQKLMHAKVLVIGAGGLGCPVLQYLAAAGTGTIGIVDDDVVSLSNLHRQVLYTVHDIGMNKAERAAAVLKQLNPEIHYLVHAQRLTVQNAFEIIGDYDIVVDGTDNFSSRYLINDACVLMNKPLVFGAVYRFEGQVTVFNYRDNAHEEPVNYRDLFPIPPQAGEVRSCAEAGVLGVVPGILGVMMANEVIKGVTGIGTLLNGRLLTYNAYNNQVYELALQVNREARVTMPADKKEFMKMDYDWICGVGENGLEIDYHTFTDLVRAGDVMVIDVREAHEIPAFGEFDAVNIPQQQLSRDLSRIHAGSVVTVCQSGQRSLIAARELVDAFGNTKKIYSLKGGVMQWALLQKKELS